MFKKLAIAIGMSLVVSACGSTVESASVDIVDPGEINEVTDNSTLGSASGDSDGSQSDEDVTLPADDAGADGTDSDRTDSDGTDSGTVEIDSTDGSDSDSDDSTQADGSTGTGDDGDGLSRIETAGPEQISLTSEENLISTHMRTPTKGRALLTVDAVITTKQYGENVAADSNKFVIVQYQLLGVEGGNIFDESFRVLTDGQTFSPVSGINEIAENGKPLNSEVVFELPSSSQELVFEGGVPEGSVDGFTTRYQIQLKPYDPANPVEGPAPTVSDDVAEAEAASITLVTDDDVMSFKPQNIDRGRGSLRVLGASSTIKIDGDGSGPLLKFVVVEFELQSTESNNLFDNAFRLEAGGELYPTLTNINEVPEPGAVVRGSIVFMVPRDIFEFGFEGGVPELWTDGERARYKIVFSEQALSE